MDQLSFDTGQTWFNDNNKLILYYLAYFGFFPKIALGILWFNVYITSEDIIKSGETHYKEGREREEGKKEREREREHSRPERKKKEGREEGKEVAKDLYTTLTLMSIVFRFFKQFQCLIIFLILNGSKQHTNITRPNSILSPGPVS